MKSGKSNNLEQDPPPDLAVEIDMTHTDINKLQLDASLGIPEFWRDHGEILRIDQLKNNSYQEV